MVAVDGIELEAIKNAARAFLQGKVMRDNNTFAPSCAEFAERCRDEANMLAARRRPKIESKDQEKPYSPPVAPEKMQLLREAMKGNASSAKKLRDMGYDIEVYMNE